MIGFPAPQNAPNSAPHQLELNRAVSCYKYADTAVLDSLTQLVTKRAASFDLCGIPVRHFGKLQRIDDILELWLVIK